MTTLDKLHNWANTNRYFNIRWDNDRKEKSITLVTKEKRVKVTTEDIGQESLARLIEEALSAWENQGPDKTFEIALNLKSYNDESLGHEALKEVKEALSYSCEVINSVCHGKIHSFFFLVQVKSQDQIQAKHKMESIVSEIWSPSDYCLFVDKWISIREV